MKRSKLVRRTVLVSVVSLFVFVGVGCSTVSGFADFVGGAARDIKDASEGSRDKSSEMGSWSGVYGGRN